MCCICRNRHVLAECETLIVNRPGVKPNTVLYGRNLPSKFFECCEKDFDENATDCTDLLLVIGTSLTVSPANSLVNMVR